MIHDIAAKAWYFPSQTTGVQPMFSRIFKLSLIFSFLYGASTQSLLSQNTSPGDSLSLGLAVPTTEIGQPYIAERIGDWNLRCIRTQDGNDPCELTQVLINEQNEPVSEVTLFKLPAGQPAVAGANVHFQSKQPKLCRREALDRLPRDQSTLHPTSAYE